MPWRFWQRRLAALRFRRMSIDACPISLRKAEPREVRYYGWRPNLPDEADNHLIELALAGNAEAIVTHNVRDIRGGELHLGALRIVTPAQCLEEWR